MLPEPDRVRLQHMRDAATKAVRLASRKQRQDLADEESPLTDALVRLIGVVGTAAGRVSPETRLLLPAIPWADVVGMRNRLIHDYFDINLDILWATVQDDLPELVAALEPVLRSVERSG